MRMKLELVPIPVADVERAKAFYVDRLGFAVDVDVAPAEGVRVVQLTPPGSECSIVLGQGLAPLSGSVPGAVKGVHLVVEDIRQARDQLVEAGVAVEEIVDAGRGVLLAGFADPDGNTWALQEMPWRTGSSY